MQMYKPKPLQSVQRLNYNLDAAQLLKLGQDTPASKILDDGHRQAIAVHSKLFVRCFKVSTHGRHGFKQ
jgi:hypothetical protein